MVKILRNFVSIGGRHIEFMASGSSQQYSQQFH
jgi:hypothetical protein